MKKVLLGILTLIPVIVLLVVAMVSNIVALQAHISVEDVFLRLKSTAKRFILSEANFWIRRKS